MRDPLDPFDDFEERVQGPFDEGDKTTWCDRNGDAHRLDGPAVEFKTGGKKIWCLHGQEVTEAEVADYRLKLEAEGERRRKQEYGRMVEAEAEEAHTGLKRDIKPFPPIRFKEKEPLKKVWG
jgi:hypothetical protein